MSKNNKAEDFDFSQIPSNVQYDIITLPSKGVCYPHKIGKIPVAYLTAADENVIASPNLYRDGKVLDVILSRKILDKRVNPLELTKGDRDAIILWLRATGYGPEFPVLTTNPKTGKEHKTTIDLSTLNYKPFDLKGDEDGNFDYKCTNGDVIKFRFVTKKDEENFFDIRRMDNALLDKQAIKHAIDDISSAIAHGNMDEEHADMLTQYLDDITKIADDIPIDEEVITAEDEILPIFTDTMKLYTVSVNGNSDREFVESYIENMRVGEARMYREYVNSNIPGVDLEIEIPVDESDGGGSFKTFLTVDESCFITL